MKNVFLFLWEKLNGLFGQPSAMEMNLINVITLHELNQMKKVTYGIILCVYRINKNTKIESSLVDSRGWAEEGKGSN